MKHTVLEEKKSNASVTSTKERTRRQRGSGFVVCIDNSEYPASLELHKVYRLVRDEEAAKEGDIRVVDESGEDYLYPAGWFIPVDIPPALKVSLLRAS